MTFSTDALTAGDGADVEARPDRFVVAARALANETGSAAFTVAQLTARAGLSLKSFYACFHGKDELLLALLAEDSAIGAQFLAERVGDRAGLDAVRAYVFELFDALALPGATGYASVLVREHRRLVEFHDAELRQALAPLIDLLAAHLGTANAARDARTMFGVLLDGIHDIVVGRVGDTRELADYLYEFCMNGLARA